MWWMCQTKKNYVHNQLLQVRNYYLHSVNYRLSHSFFFVRCADDKILSWKLRHLPKHTYTQVPLSIWITVTVNVTFDIQKENTQDTPTKIKSIHGGSLNTRIHEHVQRACFSDRKKEIMLKCLSFLHSMNWRRRKQEAKNEVGNEMYDMWNGMETKNYQTPFDYVVECLYWHMFSSFRFFLLENLYDFWHVSDSKYIPSFTSARALMVSKMPLRQIIFHILNIVAASEPFSMKSPPSEY